MKKGSKAMRALLDINVIIALLDPDHAFHERSHAWWAQNHHNGWATCPITENGVVRIMSSIGYGREYRFTPGELIGQLRRFSEQTDHEFWEDSISLRSEAIFSENLIHNSRQITDLYLLALAVTRDGRLATFDEKITLSPVLGAKEKNLCLIH
jgi:toxin-antitoxin system PIN domain toxin